MDYDKEVLGCGLRCMTTLLAKRGRRRASAEKPGRNRVERTPDDAARRERKRRKPLVGKPRRRVPKHVVRERGGWWDGCLASRVGHRHHFSAHPKVGTRRRGFPTTLWRSRSVRVRVPYRLLITESPRMLSLAREAAEIRVATKCDLSQTALILVPFLTEPYLPSRSPTEEFRGSVKHRFLL